MSKHRSNAAASGARFAATTAWIDANGRHAPAPRRQTRSRQRAGRQACHPRRASTRPDRRARARLCAGQSRHPAKSARRRFLALLPTQSQALPAASARRSRATGGCRTLGDDLDIRTDLPRYQASGTTASWLTSRPTCASSGATISSVFALGCSFSFEEALMPDGIELRHITLRLQRADVSHLDRDARGRPVPRPDGGVDAAADSRPTRSAPSRSRRAFRRCMARRCISASRN